MTNLERPSSSVLDSSLQSRVLNVVAALGFALTLVWTYAHVLTHLYAYLGFTYVAPDAKIFIVAVIVAVVPGFALPLEVRRPSQFVIWFVFYGLYIPAEVMPVLMGVLSNEQILKLILAVAIAFAIICIPPRGSVEKVENRPFTIDSGMFWTVFGFVYIALTIWVFVAYGGHLRIVGFSDIYEQRSTSDQITEGSLVGYGTGLLAGAMNPFLISLGLTRRKPMLYFMGAGGQLLVFAASALKFVFLSIAAIPVFYFMLFRKDGCRISNLGLWYFIAAFGVTLAYQMFEGPQQGIVMIVFAVAYMRTFCMPGAILGSYTEFFMSHPFTYYSHVNLFRMFLHYPYPGPVGYVIGTYITPTWVDADANASFIATDGMAACGFLGVVISGILFRLILLALDSERLRSNLPLICCALIPGIVLFLNTSLFSTLLSGGVGMLMLLLYLYSLVRREDESRSPDQANLVEYSSEPAQ